MFDRLTAPFRRPTAEVRVPRPSDAFPIGRSRDGAPIYAPYEFDQMFYWALGATRSGKTSMFMYPYMKQRIKRNDCPIIYCDLKGEDWLFHAMRELAEAEGRSFRWFSNVPYFSTYLFNPLNQSAFDKLLPYQLAQLLLNSLNLWYGFGYGKFFFGSQARRTLAKAFNFRSTGDPSNAWMPTPASSKITSFSELLERVNSVTSDKEARNNAEQLVMVLEDLAAVLQIDWQKQKDAIPQEAIDQSIHVPDLLVPDENGRYPVVYFYLRAQTELVGISQVVKLLLYATVTARKQAEDFFKLGQRDTSPPVVSFAIDEFGNVADEGIRNVVEQAAGLGVHFVFANQDISQLQNGDTDLLPTIWENAGSKIIFTGRDIAFQDRLMKASGEHKEHLASYAVSHPAYGQGKVLPQNALHVCNGQWTPINVAETITPRITRDELVGMSVEPNEFLYMPPYASVRTNLDGYPMILRGEYGLSREEFDRLSNKPWPMDEPGTIVPSELLAED